jgi:hypothetical protein
LTTTESEQLFADIDVRTVIETGGGNDNDIDAFSSVYR